MNVQQQEVWQLLYPRVPHHLSRGYRNGLFNPQKDQFFAATFVSELSDADDLRSLTSLFDGYSIVSTPVSQPGPVPEPRWELLPPGSGLQPAECKAYSIVFQGALYEGEWTILRSLTLFETADEKLATNTIFPKDVFNQSIYAPCQEQSYLYNNNVELSEFAAAPLLVAIVLKQAKERLNYAFRYYLEMSVLQPLAAKLRIYYPDRYDSMTGMFGTEHFSSIFPQHKRFVLLATGAKGLTENSYTTRYLLYIQESGNIYEWKYFPPGAAFHYAESVIDQLKTLTYWDDVRYLHSSCTLNDDRFWEQYIFQREKGKYKYLQELTFNGERLPWRL